MFRPAVLLSLVLVPTVALGTDLGFHPDGPGLYRFDTGLYQGQLKVDGKYQGLYPLVDKKTGADLVRGPGIFSPYRVFSGKTRFGNAARDWPTTTKLQPDGAVSVHWANAEHPVEFDSIYRWSAPDTLDFEVTARAKRDLPQFELFMSSYFLKGFRALAYLKRPGEDRAAFVPVDRRPGQSGGYVMIPKDQAAVGIIENGRWDVPPSPVRWAIERFMAAPILVRRDAELGLTGAIMARPEDCFAVSSPWNPDKPDAGGYRSIYLSLFGGDLAAGSPVTARCRMVLARDLSDEEVLARYQRFSK